MHILYLQVILPKPRFANNCHVFFLSTKTVVVITQIDIKYCCTCCKLPSIIGPWKCNFRILESPWISLPRYSGNPGKCKERYADQGARQYECS